MRLVGYSFARSDGPLSVGYLPLGDLTVVVGPNDAGKTRLLKGLAAHLSRTSTSDLGDEDAVFFVELLDSERKDFADSVESEMSSPDGVSSVRISPAPEDEVMPTHEPSVFAIVEGLGERTAEAFKCAEPTQDPVAYSTARRGALDVHGEFITRRALWVEGCPIPASPVDVSTLPDLPVPIQLPISTEALVATAVEAIESLVAATSLVQMCLAPVISVIEEEDDDFDGRLAAGSQLVDLLADPALGVRLQENYWLVEPPPERLAPDQLLGVKLAGQVLGATKVLQGTANEVLPNFVSESYELAVGLRLPSWEARSPLDFFLVSKGSDGFEFPLDDAAEGFRLWIQLAVLEGVDAVRAQEVWLWMSAHTVKIAWLILDQALTDLEGARRAESETDEMGAQQAVDEADLFLRGALVILCEHLRKISAGEPGETLRGRAFTRTSGEGSEDGWQSRMNHLKARLYLIDEPERHLHPRLQREASTWLAETMSERRSQCIVATHAIPFMNLGRGTQYVAAQRDDRGETRLDAFSPELVTALSEFAGELGFNRGQLLATVNLFLFVEGRADQRVLEALFLKRFFEAGIAVVPLQGAKNAPQVIDVDALLRYSGAKAAVLLDDLSIETVSRLQNEEGFRHESLRSPDITLSKMAQLVESARLHGRLVEPFGLPSHDIFGMLDEQILQEEYPRFPGHEAALQDWKNSGEKAWKAFFSEQYGIPQEIDLLYVPIADGMRERDVIPATLLALIDDIERYAFS